MKRKLKVIAAILLVLIMFISAMPMQLAAEAMTPPTTRYATPDGYNDYDYQKMVRFLYKGIIIKHNKTEPTYTKTSLFLCEKRRFFMARTEKGVVTTI